MIACYTVPLLGIACERARLPHLWGEPVALMEADGVLTTVSEEAAQYGIRMGQPVTAARAYCPQLIVLHYDRAAYMQAAECLWDLYAVESSVVEPISPEVCYVELTGLDAPNRARELARQIACRVRAPVWVGLAYSKLVATQAAGHQDNQTLVVEAGREADLLADLPLSRIAQLDAGVHARLERLGLRTLDDVRRIPVQTLQREFKQAGLLLRRLAQGQDGDRVRALWPPRTVERSVRFEDEVCHAPIVEEALLRCARALSRVLRARHEFCRSLALTVGLADGGCAQEQERLMTPAADTAALHRAALRLLGRLRVDRPVVEVRLSAADLGAGSGVQLALLDEQGNALPHERRQKLEATLGCLKRRYGFSAVLPAALLLQARRIDLWTHALARRKSETITVVTDEQGMPQRFCRHGERYCVLEVQDRWREADWFGSEAVVKTAYRIVTEPTGFYELHRIGVVWRLGGIAD